MFCFSIVRIQNGEKSSSVLKTGLFKLLNNRLISGKKMQPILASKSHEKKDLNPLNGIVKEKCTNKNFLYSFKSNK